MARSRTSGEYLFVALFRMLHPTHELEPPANPVRFIPFGPVYVQQVKVGQTLHQSEGFRGGRSRSKAIRAASAFHRKSTNLRSCAS